MLLHAARNTWTNEEVNKSSGDGLGSLQYDKAAGSWNANMYVDPQEGIQAPRFWSLAQHAKDMLEPSVKGQLEACAESVGRLWSVSDPDLFETGFFVGHRLFVSGLRLGNLKAAKLENMSVAGYVSIASWGETCPQSGQAVKCLWANDAADFGLFLVINKDFRAPSYLDLPEVTLSGVKNSLQYGDIVVAISYNGTPDRNLLEERNALRCHDLDEDDRPKIPDDIGPILHPNAKTVASGYIVGLPGKEDDPNSSAFRISSSLWGGSSGGPIFLLRDHKIKLIGMVSLYAGDREGNDAALLFEWHKNKMNVAIKRAQEQNMLDDDEIRILRKTEEKPKKKPRKEVRFAPLPKPISPLPKSQTEAAPRNTDLATNIDLTTNTDLTTTLTTNTDLTTTITTKRLARQKSSNQHYLTQPRTLFNDSVHYLLVVAFILVFCVLQLHPKS